jgi:hypothetical protein
MHFHGASYFIEFNRSFKFLLGGTNGFWKRFLLLGKFGSWEDESL